MTHVPFSAEETLKLAAFIEENGREFYQGMVEEAENEELSELFEELANEKKEHGNRFKKMLGEESDGEGYDLNKQLYGKLEDSYLEVLGDSKVFTPANENIQAAREAKSRGQLISVAISLEKDTMLYFYEILDRAASEYDREIIEDILDEEKNQIKRLIKFRSGA
jgi:rubrerythrin